MKLQSFVEVNPGACIVMDDGRRITLMRLEQCSTYAGLLAGLPRSSIDQWILDNALSHAKRAFGERPRPHLITPDRISYQLAPLKQRATREWSGGEGEGMKLADGMRLPLVLCTGSFTSKVITSTDEPFTYSMATMVWLQDPLAMPIDPQIIRRIQAVSWSRIAIDCCD